MVTLTKQDIQNMLDNARNRLMERVASRQDVLVLQDTIKSLTVTLQQSQQLLRQNEYQRVQLVRRAVAMESRMVQMEQELQNVRRALNQVANMRPSERVTERVIMAQPEPAREEPVQGYTYNPNPAA